MENIKKNFGFGCMRLPLKDGEIDLAETSRMVDYFLEPDRKKAIRRALELMEKGDTTVIAGKGAERYQEIRGVKYPYNDREYVLELIGEKP